VVDVVHGADPHPALGGGRERRGEGVGGRARELQVIDREVEAALRRRDEGGQPRRNRVGDLAVVLEKGELDG